MQKRGKRGQVTIFIIAGILIIAIIALFFVFRGGGILKGVGIGGGFEENPEFFLESCLEPKIKETTKLISSQGGYIENPLHIELDGIKIAYLCYTQNYYASCINQEPLLLNHLKKEIKKDIRDDVENCFQDLKTNFEEQAYNIQLSQGDFNIELAPKRVSVIINRDLTLIKSGKTTRFDRLEVNVPSRFYDLAIVVQEITSQEARLCNFEQQGFMLFYPEFNIDQFRTGDGDIIYTVQHRKTNEQFKFAIRGCVIPPGF